MRQIFTCILLFIFGFTHTSQACDESTITIASQVDNGDGTVTYCFDLFIELGGLDATFYGFALEFLSSSGTPVVQSGFPTPLSPTTGNADPLTGNTGSAINSTVNDASWNEYLNRTDVLSYEWGGTFGASSIDNTYNGLCVTVAGCVDNIVFDSNVNADNTDCEHSASTGVSCLPCMVDIGTSNVTGGTLVGANEYDLDFGSTITFTQSGYTLPPAAGADPAGIVWAVFTCMPTNLTDPQADPCYLGVDFGDSVSDTNSGMIPSPSAFFSTVWLYPITFDDAVDGGNGTGVDVNGDGCIDSGDIFQLNYLPESLCDCASPTCPAGANVDDSNIQFTDCISPTTPYTDVTFTTCHTVTTDANGNLGVVQSLGGGGNMACIDGMLASRTSELFLASGGQCSGAPIPPTVANGGNSATFNPEWTGLSPNTDYIICITVTIPDNTCDVQEVCVDYYGEPVPCGTCADPNCPIGNVPTYDDRSFMTCAIQGTNTPIPFTNCYQAQADATGFLGFANTLQNSTNDPFCLNGDITSTWELTALNDCGNVIPNPIPNANGVTSGFNPEYSGLTPNAQYVLCVTYDTNFPFDCTGINTLCLDYYGSDCMPPAAVTITGDNAPCSGSTGVAYSVPAEAGTTFTWTVPAGATITGQGSNSITVDFGTTSGDVCVTAANGCPDDQMACFPVSFQTITLSATPTATTCGGTDGSISLSSNGTPTLTYMWSPMTGNLSGNTISDLPMGTYNITVTDADGCTATASATVNDGPEITLSATPTPTTCGGTDGSINLSSNGTPGLTYTWSPLVGNLSGNTLEDLPMGSYNFTVTDANGCTQTASATVNDGPQITLSATPTPTTCGGTDGSIDLSSNGTPGLTYTWSPPVGNLSGNTLEDLPMGSYDFTVTDANGCTQTASATVNDGPQITLSATPTPTTCGGTDGSIDLSSNGTPGLTYTWSPPVGNLSGNTLEDLPMGSYNFTVTDANGCTQTASATVNDGPQITLSAVATPTSCGGNADGTVTLSPNGTPNYTYVWSPMNGTIAGNVISNLPSGPIGITVTDANGCTAETTATVNLGNDPTVSAVPTDASCTGVDNGSITASGSGGTPNYTYSIDGISFQTSGTFNNLMPGNYTITVQDANGCTNTTTTTIGVGAGPTVSANGTDESCPGENDGTISASGNGGTPNYMYSIDGVNFQISGTFTAVGMGNYTITIQDANGCTNTTSVNIGVGAAPSITSITPANPSDCGVDDGSITVNATGTNLEYSIDGGGSWQASNVFNGLSAGSYAVLVRVVGSTNCTDMDTVNLTAPSAPSLMVASTNPTDCGVDDGTITITGMGTNLEYSINGMDWFPTNVFTGLPAGNYTVMVREVDSPTCTASGNANLVAPMPPMIANVNSTDPSDCGVDDGTITILPNDAAWEYSINGTDWFTTNIFTGLAAGNFTVMVRLAASPNCTDTDSAMLNAPNAPIIDALIPTNPSDCGTTDGTIVVNATGTNLEYSIDNGATWQTGNLFSNLPAGAYTILIREIASPNCGDSETTTLTAPSSPTIDMVNGTDPSDCGVDDGTITITATGVNLEYSNDGGATWQPSNVFTGLSSGNYTVMVREVGTTDCTDMDMVILNAPSAPVIDNVAIVDASDCGAMDGSITITATGTNLEYSIDNVNWQASNVFPNLNGGVYTIFVREVASPDCVTTNNANIVSPDFPMITNVATTDPSDCGVNNGTITVTATGVNLEYSIDGGATWQSSNQFSGLSAGTYDPILIREISTMNCTDADAATLFAPSAPVITDVTSTNPTDCGGTDGTITVTATGTNLEYSLDGVVYQTGNVFTNVAAGNYTVFVREIASPDCETTATANLVTPVAPTIIDVTSTNPSDCGVNDGTITVDANGTNLEYSNDGGTTWQASNMFMGLSAGNFIVIAREVGTVDCTDTEMVNLTAPSAPMISDVAIVDASDCGAMDGSITVTATGTNLEYSIDGMNFQMSNIFPNLNGGIYTITVREVDSPDCFTTDNANILAPIAPSITDVAFTDPTDCGTDNGTITITATGDDLEYSIDGGTTFQASNQFSGLSAGNYNIVVQIMNTMNCTATDMVTLTAPSAPMITDVSSTNPTDCGLTDGTITITATGVNLEYSINGTDWFASNIFMNVDGGMYTVFVREVASPDCSVTDNVTLVSPETPIIVMVETTDPTDCGVDDGTITITATGTNLEYSIDNGATFQMGNVFNMLAANAYGIVVREVGTVTCTASDNVTLNALTAPTITNVASTNPTDCNVNDGTITVSGNGANLEYSIDGGMSFQANNLFENLPAGDYDIVIREIGTITCTATDMVTLTGLTAPMIDMVNSTNPSDCGVDDGTITITATGTGTNLEYSIDGNNWQMSNIFNGLSAGNYNVFVREIGTTNCTDMDTAMLSTPNAPTISDVISTDPTDCGTNDGTITITAMGANLEYSIDGGTTYFPTNIFTDLPAGNYVIVVREQASPTCTISDNATLTAPETPVIIDLITTNPSDCGIDDGTITVIATGANIMCSIDGGITFQTSTIFDNLSAGNYTVLVINANAVNCTDSDVATLEAPGAPTITDLVATNPNDCGTDDGTITVTAMGMNLEYSIDGINWQMSNIFNGLADGNYTVMVRDANATNCSASDMTMLTAPTAPMITDIATTDPACGMDNGSITITGMGANLEYSIDGGVTFQTSNVFNDLAGGDFDIVIREIGTMNCTDAGMATLTSTSAPTIDNISTINPTGCNTNDGSITITPMSASLEYSIDGGATFQASNVFNGLNDGSFDIVVQVVGTMNCSVTDNAVLDAPIVANVTNVEVNCSTDNTTYTITFDITGGNPANFTVMGNAGTLNGSTFTSDPIPSGDSYSFTFSYAPGCPTEVLGGVINCDCPTITPTVTILSDFNGVNVSCFGGSDGSASVTNINGGASPYTYAWSNGETGVTASALSNGWQYVTVTDANGCPAVDSVQLTAPPALVMNPIVTATTCFENQDGTVAFDNVSGGTAPYLYSLNNSPLAMDTFYMNLAGGVYPAVVQDANGCEVSQNVVVDAANQLEVDLGDDQTIQLGETVTLDPAYSAPSVDSFIWTTTGILDCFDCENPTAAPFEATTYNVTVVDANGCSASDAVTIFVTKNVEVFVPNVFSPNNDGVNDFLTVYAGKGVTEVKKFMIFDRWGESMWIGENFAPNIETLGWDGTFRTKAQNPGVYVYYAEVVLSDGTIETVKGDVTLIK